MSLRLPLSSPAEEFAGKDFDREWTRMDEFTARPSLGHAHYSEAVQAIVKELERILPKLERQRRRGRANGPGEVDQAQACWNELMRARKQETGVAYYLDPEQYKEALRVHNS